MKLRLKYFVWMSVLTIIPLLLFAFYSYHRYTETTYQRMDEFSNNLFENAVTSADNTLDSISQTISFLTFYGNDDENSIVGTLKKFTEGKKYNSYDVWSANHYCTSVFQNLMLSNNDIEGIYLFTPGNENFYCCNTLTGQLTPNYDPREETWYQDTIALNGKYYINTETSDLMFTKKNNCIYIARSISEVYSHQFLGVILVACNSNILDLTNVNTMPKITRLTVSNTSTNQILYSNAEDLDDQFDQANIITKMAELGIKPLQLTADFNYDSLFSEFNLTGSVLVTIAILLAAILIFSAYILSKSLVHPLENLSSIMSEQRNHAFSFSSPYMNRTDEIGTLYNEYANMLEELDESIKRDYKDKLIILDAQMKSLEARINSHFLFNTLESINSIAELDDNEPIATMSLALGNMFRYTIKTQSELVSLEEELQHVADYVAIQSIRFSNRFKLHLEIPEELRKQKVLKLILQPLVENSLYHGLNYCTRGDLITIKAWEEGSTMFLSVADNGMGMSEEVLKELRARLQEEASFTELGHRNKQSIGLKNIHSRIELYYGKGYGLFIESKEAEGTTITIRIPVV